MKNTSVFVLAVCAAAILSACSNQNETPEGAVKDFLATTESADVEKFTSHLGGELKELVLAKKSEIQKNLDESKSKIDKCGGIKSLTSTYSVTEGATTVEGHTLIDYKGACPAEKQYLNLVKNEKVWLIDKIGPSIKMPQ